jgi:imidazole glycerol-phosphate synthase subunit HisF
MLKKRVIFTLLYDSGAFMLSRNFRLQKVGDLNWLKKNYNFSKIAFSIDELIILDVSRGERDSEKFREHVQSLSEECFIPIAAGGGVRNIDAARKLLRSGADKVVLNTLLVKEKDSVVAIASEFGRQCLVASVDIKRNENLTSVWIENGDFDCGLSLPGHLKEILALPIGELYLNSIDRDGTGQGYDMGLLDLLQQQARVPVILAGGAGKDAHLIEGLNDRRVDAVATAHLFNFIGDGLLNARSSIRTAGISLAKWNENHEKIFSKEVDKRICN